MPLGKSPETLSTCPRNDLSSKDSRTPTILRAARTNCALARETASLGCAIMAGGVMGGGTRSLLTLGCLRWSLRLPEVSPRLAAVLAFELLALGFSSAATCLSSEAALSLTTSRGLR